MAARKGAPRINSTILAVVLLASGIALLAISLLVTSQILALMGLGLTFWGALFILITPQKNIEGNFLETTTAPEYMTIDRIIKELKPKNEAFCIPPYPKDVYLPEHLKGLKEMVIYIPAENANGMAAIEELAKGKFQIENPKGILITPPGIGILERIEQKRSADLTKIPLSELAETLPRLLNDLNLTNEITMAINENEVSLKITGSLYKNLYSQEYSLKSINLLGCPIVNAAACAIAKSTGKPTMIQKIETTPNGQTTTVTFKIVQS